MKVKHQNWLRAGTDQIKTLYPEIIQESNGEDWSWITMLWWDGDSIIEGVYTGKVTLDLFCRRLQRVLDFLFIHGYAHTITVSYPEYSTNAYISRVKRRLQYLLRTELKPIVLADELVVNGVKCFNPIVLLDRIEASENLRRAINPPKLYFPLHGDLNLRNLLIKNQFDEAEDNDLGHYIHLLDPRGEITQWDISYDIGKMFFSVSLFEALQDSSFTIDYSCESKFPKVTVQASSNWLTHFEAVLTAFCTALNRASTFRTMLEREEPLWQHRLLFVHACHTLAEAACRVSAHTRDPGVEEIGIFRTGLNHAAILYALGALMLDQWYQGMISHSLQGPEDLLKSFPNWFGKAPHTHG